VNPNKQAETTGSNDNRADESARQAAGTGRQQARGQAARAAPMRCPECGEPAASRTPADRVPREARHAVPAVLAYRRVGVVPGARPIGRLPARTARSGRVGSFVYHPVRPAAQHAPPVAVSRCWSRTEPG
jgi:hypothetical protein